MSNQTQLQYKTKNYLLKNYARHPVEFVKGQGAYLYDKDGNQYLDFLSGIAVTSFGHNHKQIKSAVKDQLDKIWHTSNLFDNSLQEIVAEKLCLKSGLDFAFFCNSGTEANEAAIKFARKWGQGRSTIITAIGGFHGRTMGSLSASAQYKLWDGFFPLTPGFNYVPFNDVDAIESSINQHTAAIMIEPIQGENGVIIPSENYLKNVRKICDENNLLLIIDEVQTGFGRTGRYFAYQWEEIKPDILTLAKGIANGLPLGAVVVSEKVAEAITPGSHGTTFGGNYLALASSNVVLDLLTDELLDDINTKGNLIFNEIKKQNFSSIKDIRYKGLMIGVELIESIDVKTVVKKLLENKLVTTSAGNNTIRLLPPFIIAENEINKLIELFLKTFKMI